MREDRLRRLQIGLVNICNYRCPLCRTLLDDHVVRRRMTIDELKRIIMPIAPALENVTLYGTRGEPFLHPDLESAISLIKHETRASVDVSTNGSLVDAQRAENILESGLDRIIFAIDGLTQKSYAAYRVGGQLERVLKNLAVLCDLKRRGNYETRIVFQLIPMSTNEAEIERLPKMARELGVDEVRLKLSSSVTRSSEFRPGDDYIPDKKSQTFECPFGLGKLYVDPSGDCYSCCYGEGHAEMKLGNALQTDIRRIWKSPDARRIRRAFSRGRGHARFCVDRCADRLPRKKIKLPILESP